VSVASLLYGLLLALVAGATAFSGIALYGVFRFLKNSRDLARRTAAGGYTPPVSLLKPLYGLDRELEENLESFFRQDYPCYEILCSVREETDPAVAVVRRLQEKYPAVPVRLLLTGQPPYLNAKVHGMEALLEAAAHEVLVINDSDVRAAPGYLRSVVAPLAETMQGMTVGPSAAPPVGMVTCISRGVPGRSLWSLLEALSMSLQFVAGVLAAAVTEGIQFSLGPTMVIRKATVNQIGGFRRLADYLADDFVLGQLVAEAGYRVVLAPAIPDHLVCNESFADSLRHRLRWERSSRRSRPAGYLGQVFTHGLPLALVAWALAPAGNALALPLVAACLTMRTLLAWAVGWRLLRDPAFRAYWWLLPLQDILSFLIWLWAFFGGEIEWRGTRFRVLRGGKLERVDTGGSVRSAIKAGSTE